MKKDKNIVKFHKSFQINIGLVIFAIIIIYVLFHVFSYLTSETLTVYEVTEGAISNDTTYQALAIRQEKVIQSPSSGDLFYYAGNMDSVGVKTNIFSIDHSNTITQKLSQLQSNTDSLSEIDQRKITDKLNDFALTYNGNNFYRIYSFKNDLASDLQQYYSSNLLSEMDGELSQAIKKGDFSFYTAPEPGVVVYQIDGMEDVTVDNFSKDSFQKKLEINNLKNQTSIKEGQTVYKLITSDRWHLVIPVEKELVDKINNEKMEYLQIRFIEDNALSWTSCHVEKKGKQNYLILDLDDSVSRYADERYVPISLLFSEESGLKIPNTAIVTKEFFAIPHEYFYKGNDSEDTGVMVKAADGGAELVVPTIYYEDDNNAYVDSEKLSPSDILVKPDSSSTYVVGSVTDTKQGVYNINKGYAIFKQIEILYQNEDYSIVKKGTSYGISNYDHIALQGEQINENDLINK